jgi:hypothetical protein
MDVLEHLQTAADELRRATDGIRAQNTLTTAERRRTNSCLQDVQVELQRAAFAFESLQQRSPNAQAVSGPPGVPAGLMERTDHGGH